MMNMDVELDGLFRQNGTYNYDDDYEYVEDTESRPSEAVFIPVLYCVELVIGLLGNGLLLAVLAQKRRSWSISDTFILHLSVADILLLATLPFWAAQATKQCLWCFSGFLCKICGAVFYINFYCGIFLLVCISLDRYLSIVHATQLYSHKKPRLAHISCLSVWLVSLILTIPHWIFLVARKDVVPQCVHSYTQSVTDWKLGSRLLHHTLGFLLPAVALIICCSCILLQLKRSSEGLQKQRAIMVILPLVVVFFLCWMPYNITLIVDTFRNSSKEPDIELSGNPQRSLKINALMVTSGLGCMHACLRPLLYLCLCGNFRKRTLAMLKRTTVESESSLWELGVGEEAPPDQNHEEEEAKPMTSVDHQVPSSQC
ncbi:C-X-C chemokine receptor type 3-like isoform X2 [Sander lucioperca]|uniref:C-X-C motif chemokine receptor 3 n=1 Tax=Sander lucioperca TaxID=283035 RepID=A0A8C9ZYI1_SANLU|nr:C-X-C chemokine receptor type 3-like isoform X2 [Sander lucioperca]